MLHVDDKKMHIRLAVEGKIRLPQAKTALTTAGMEKWLRRLGLSVSWYKDWSGFVTLKEFIVANPTWTLRNVVGLWLEECVPE